MTRYSRRAAFQPVPLAPMTEWRSMKNFEPENISSTFEDSFPYGTNAIRGTSPDNPTNLMRFVYLALVAVMLYFFFQGACAIFRAMPVDQNPAARVHGGKL